MSNLRERYKAQEAVRWVSDKWTIGTVPSRDGNFAKRLSGSNGERKPALCQMGNYDEPQEHPRARSRYLDVVDHFGNVVSLVLNSAAADLVNDGSQRSERLAKARHFGWFPAENSCLVRLIKAGTIKPDRILAHELLDAKVCAKDRVSCPHAELERKTRLEANRRVQEEREEGTTAQALRHERAIADASAQGIAAALAPILSKLIDTKGTK